MPVAGFEDDLLAPSQALNSTDTASPSTDSPSLAQIEDALDQLLTRLLKEREQERKKRAASGQLPPLRAITFAELDAGPVQSDDEIWREIVVEHPITGAFELAIREIGKMLFQRGGTDLMREVLERVAKRHPKTYGKRVSILDCKWDGVGGKWWH